MLDLHTAASPIFDESSLATIEDLGLDEGVEDGGEIVLYVVQRNGVQVKDAQEVRGGKAAVYTSQDVWVRNAPLL